MFITSSFLTTTNFSIKNYHKRIICSKNFKISLIYTTRVYNDKDVFIIYTKKWDKIVK